MALILLPLSEDTVEGRVWGGDSGKRGKISLENKHGLRGWWQEEGWRKGGIVYSLRTVGTNSRICEATSKA